MQKSGDCTPPSPTTKCFSADTKFVDPAEKYLPRKILLILVIMITTGHVQK